MTVEELWIIAMFLTGCYAITGRSLFLVLACAFVIISAALAATATPALADRTSLVDPLTVEGADHCFAVVQVEDRVGLYTADEVHDLPGFPDPLVVRYITHGGQSLNDEFHVMQVPSGLLATPMRGEITGEELVNRAYICVEQVLF